jgi:hypothetical protein
MGLSLIIEGVPQDNSPDAKYGTSGDFRVKSDTYSILSQEEIIKDTTNKKVKGPINKILSLFRKKDKVSNETNTETFFITIYSVESFNFEGGRLENPKQIFNGFKLQINGKYYSYYDTTFYSNDKLTDRMSQTQDGGGNITCSTNTFNGKQGKCEPSETMIEIIREKFLPTKYGKEIKSSLNYIGINV